jgi:diguanylate cyclase (GGDEF)-like protein
MQDVSLETILACQNLPSLPAVALEVMELSRDDDVDVTEIAHVVQYDPALTSKILKSVNSSYYGLSKPCPTISRAVTYLGLNTVRSLVLAFSLVDLTRRDEGTLDLLTYWRRCLYSAAAARRIALMLQSCDPEEAFIASLMQDIGMLVLDSALDRAYAAVVDEAGEDHEHLPAAERDTFGFDHADAGARLAEQWRLPHQLIEPIRLHHQPVSPTCDVLVATTSLAFQTHRLISRQATLATLSGPLFMIADVLDISLPDIQSLIVTTTEDVRELAGLLNVEVGSAPNTAAILAEAEELRLTHQMNMQRQTQQLQEANEQLSLQNMTDPLTGIANRKRFDETFAERFMLARSLHGCLGLVLVDCDRFKVVNDTYGHQVGDTVLMELARRLEDETDEDGLVCRYGGEEFAVILPGADRIATTKLAERLRQRIESVPVTTDLDGDVSHRLNITASCGAAALQPASAVAITSPPLLLLAADKALYVAKSSGRNQVRIFKPRRSADEETAVAASRESDDDARMSA